MTTTVLIVDDHETFRSFARELLESEAPGQRGHTPGGRAGAHPSAFSKLRMAEPDSSALGMNPTAPEVST